MSRKLITAALLLITASAFAQQPSTADTTPQQIIERLNLAGHLVNYGYETQTALPFIQAVKIYQELNLRPAIDGLKPTVEGETTEETPTAHARTEEQLLADATQFAKGNAHLLALIAECQTASRKPAAALFYHNDYIAPKGTHIWDVPLEGGYSNQVITHGGSIDHGFSGGPVLTRVGLNEVLDKASRQHEKCLADIKRGPRMKPVASGNNGIEGADDELAFWPETMQTKHNNP